MNKSNTISALFVAALLLTLVFLPAPASADHDAWRAARGGWSGYNGGHHDHRSSGLNVRSVFVLPPLFPFTFVAPPPVIGFSGSWRDHDRHDGRGDDCHRPDHRRWGRHDHGRW